MWCFKLFLRLLKVILKTKKNSIAMSFNFGVGYFYYCFDRFFKYLVVLGKSEPRSVYVYI